MVRVCVFHLLAHLVSSLTEVGAFCAPLEPSKTSLGNLSANYAPLERLLRILVQLSAADALLGPLAMPVGLMVAHNVQLEPMSHSLVP